MYICIITSSPSSSCHSRRRTTTSKVRLDHRCYQQLRLTTLVPVVPFSGDGSSRFENHHGRFSPSISATLIGFCSMARHLSSPSSSRVVKTGKSRLFHCRRPHVAELEPEPQTHSKAVRNASAGPVPSMVRPASHLQGCWIFSGTAYVACLYSMLSVGFRHWRVFLLCDRSLSLYFPFILCV